MSWADGKGLNTSHGKDFEWWHLSIQVDMGSNHISVTY